MNVRVCACLLVVTALLMTGCRNDPYVQAYIETVGAEKRALEDRVYELEYDLQVATDELERLKTKPAANGADNSPTRKPFSASPSREKAGSSKLDLPELEPPVIDSGRPATSPKKDSKLDFPEPEIEFGEPSKSPATNTPSMRSPTPDPTPDRPNSLRQPAPNLPQPAVPLESNRRGMSVGTSHDDRITQLYVNPFLTGGADFDNKPGDDGLAVVIEPRNAAGEFVPVAGPVSVVLLDPAKQGDAARVARWDFDTVDATRFLKKADNTIGLHLQMPWPGPPPESSKLRMFVRYETVDQRRLEAEQDVFVTLSSHLSQRWTPKIRKGDAGHSTSPVAETPSGSLLAAPPSLTTPSPASESTATRPGSNWSPNR